MLYCMKVAGACMQLPASLQHAIVVLRCRYGRPVNGKGACLIVPIRIYEHPYGVQPMHMCIHARL